MEKEEVNMLAVPKVYHQGEPLDQEFTEFSFNDISFSGKFNIIRASDGSRYSYDLLPSISHRTIQVPGGDGQYYFGTESKKREIPLSVAFDSMNEEHYKRFKIAMSDKKIHKLRFKERPDLYYLAKVQDTPDVKFVCFEENGVKIYKGEGTINFVCYVSYQYSDQKIENLEYHNVKLGVDDFDTPDSEDQYKGGMAWFEYFQGTAGNGETIIESNIGHEQGTLLQNLTTNSIPEHFRTQQVSNREYVCCKAKTNAKNDSTVLNQSDITGEFKEWRFSPEISDKIEGADSDGNKFVEFIAAADYDVKQVFKQHKAMKITTAVSLLNGQTNKQLNESAVIPSAASAEQGYRQFSPVVIENEILYVPNPQHNYVTIDTHGKHAATGETGFTQSNSNESGFGTTQYLYANEQLDFGINYDTSTFEFIGWAIVNQSQDYYDNYFNIETGLNAESFNSSIEELIQSSNSSFNYNDEVFLFQVLKERTHIDKIDITTSIDQPEYESAFDTFAAEGGIQLSPFQGEVMSDYNGKVYNTGATLALNCAPTTIKEVIPEIDGGVVFKTWRYRFENGNSAFTDWIEFKAEAQEGLVVSDYDFEIPSLPTSAPPVILHIEAVYERKEAYTIYTNFQLPDGTGASDYAIFPQQITALKDFEVLIDASHYQDTRGFSQVAWYIGADDQNLVSISAPEAIQFQTFRQEIENFKFYVSFKRDCVLKQIITERPKIDITINAKTPNSYFCAYYDSELIVASRLRAKENTTGFEYNDVQMKQYSQLTITFYDDELQAAGLFEIAPAPETQIGVDYWDITENSYNYKKQMDDSTRLSRFQFPSWSELHNAQNVNSQTIDIYYVAAPSEREVTPQVLNEESLDASETLKPPVVRSAIEPDICVYTTEFNYLDIDNQGDLDCFWKLVYGSTKPKESSQSSLQPFKILLKKLKDDKTIDDSFKPIEIISSQSYISLDNIENCIIINSKEGLIYGGVYGKPNEYSPQPVARKTTNIYNAQFSNFQRNKQQMQKIPLGLYRIVLNINNSQELNNDSSFEGCFMQISYNMIYW